MNLGHCSVAARHWKMHWRKRITSPVDASPLQDHSRHQVHDCAWSLCLSRCDVKKHSAIGALSQL
jgi:hypothetical protein